MRKADECTSGERLADMTPVVTTRLRPPTRVGAMVQREVLPTALVHLQTRRLLLMRAPAGYGKSLLMAQIYQALSSSQGQQVAWISVADIGASLQKVALHCAAALSQAVPGLEASIQALFEAQINVMAETVSAVFCNELERVALPLYLCVDDLHVLFGSPAEKFFDCLLRDAPAQMHFAVASRTDPSFSIARLRARGELGEIDGRALRFSTNEAETFFENSHSTLPSAELIELACTKTEGWPAGLQLLSLSVATGGQWVECVGALSGGKGAVGVFLAEDVISGQNDEVQAFLIHSSVLRQFNAALCNEVGERSDSCEIIRQLQRKGLFIFSLDDDDNWFRYHQLFSEFLQKRLSESNPLLMQALHQRAAQWFHAKGMFEDAMYHSLACKDFWYAARILDEGCADLFYQGQLFSLMTHVQQLPEHVLSEFPKIQLIRAWHLALEWEFDEAARVLESVFKCIRKQVDNGALTLESGSALLTVYRHRKLMLAILTDDMRTADRMCGELLADSPNDDPYLRGSFELCHLYAQRELYRLDAVDRMDVAARTYFQRAKSRFVLIWHESVIGPALVQRGDLQQATDGYRAAIAIAESIAGRGNPLGAMPAMLLAELEMELGEFNLARALWDHYLPVSEEIGLVDHLIAAYVGRARLAFLFVEHDTAAALLSHAIQFAEGKAFKRLFWHATAEQIRQALQYNDLETAMRIANKAKLTRDPSSLWPNNVTTTQTEFMAVAWIRLALARGFAKEAELLAKRWHAFAVQRSCIRTEIRMGILLTAARLALQDHTAATRALMEALSLAVPRGLVLPFVEEGEAVTRLVAKIFGISNIDGERTAFLAELRKAYEVTPERVARTQRVDLPASEMVVKVEGRLSQREIDILGFISEGLQNKEIGDRLGLTEGSVKWYMQQIYAKLGVRRRLSAFQKAKSLGLIR